MILFAKLLDVGLHNSEFFMCYKAREKLRKKSIDTWTKLERRILYLLHHLKAYTIHAKPSKRSYQGVIISPSAPDRTIVHAHIYSVIEKYFPAYRRHPGDKARPPANDRVAGSSDRPGNYI